MKQTAGPGSVSDAEQRANRESNVDPTKIPALGAYNKEVFDYCKKHRINPIISELRHSYFWDGGISCCTQDLTRRGGLETYL